MSADLPSVGDIKKIWKKTDDFVSPLTGTRYTTWLSPSGRLVATIHKVDDEVAAILDTRTNQPIYLHPRTEEGLEMLRKL